MLTSVWTMIDGLRIHGRISLNSLPNNHDPVVLVHGLNVSSRSMVPTAARLASDRRVYAPDLPGFGRSQHPRHVLRIPELADTLGRWMDIYNIGPAVLLGNSMGCQIIADLAVRFPAKVTYAVLVGPTIDPQGRTMFEQARRLLIDVFHEPVSSIVTQARDYLAIGPRRTLQTLRYALEDRIEAKAPLMHMPTLVVRGTNDPIAPQRWVEELARRLPHGRVAVLPHASHAANYSAPDALARVVRAFCDHNSPAAQDHEGWRAEASSTTSDLEIR